jgi:tRNA 2-selenouridine synthase
MSSTKLDILKFLDLSESIPIVDVRSPLEFNTGHIPGSVNIPLFTDEQRAIVGTKYKREGRQSAIIEGLRLSSPEMSLKLNSALKISEKNRLLVHCWRGGMRSESMAWLFSLGDIHTDILDGGYKAYRHYVLDSLSERRKIILLGGMTGSSKTHILKFLKNRGVQSIDLEGLANHKGSAFGSLGQMPQPTTEQFSNLLFNEWRSLPMENPLWLEDESRNIGTVFIPDCIYLNMQEAPIIILIMDIKTRMPRLMQEYSVFSPELLISSVERIKKRLGGDNTKDAIDAIESGDISKAIEISLTYYDKAYRFGISKKKSQNVIYVETDTDDIEVNAEKILEASKKIVW